MKPWEEHDSDPMPDFMYLQEQKGPFNPMSSFGKAAPFQVCTIPGGARLCKSGYEIHATSSNGDLTSHLILLCYILLKTLQFAFISACWIGLLSTHRSKKFSHKREAGQSHDHNESGRRYWPFHHAQPSLRVIRTGRTTCIWQPASSNTIMEYYPKTSIQSIL
jgi:hypothetical protein